MADKIGICDNCNARYKIPATFKGSKAKCKKCEGVVVIQDAEAAPAAEAKPAAKETKRPASRRGRTAAAASGGRAGGRGSRSAARGRRGKDADDGGEEAEAGGRAGRRGRRAPAEKKGNNMMVIGGVALILIIGGVFGVMQLMGDDEPTNDNTVAASEKGDGTDPGAGTDAAKTDAAETASTDADTSAADAEAEAAAAAAEAEAKAKADAAAEAAKEPEILSPLISFDTFDKLPETTDEEWTAISEAVSGMKAGGRRRKDFMKQLIPYGIKALPAIINTLNGVDLTDSFRWADAFEVCKFTREEITYDVIKIPFKGDFSEDPEVVNYNVRSITSLVTYWTNTSADPDKVASLPGKIAAAKAAKEAREG